MSFVKYNQNNNPNIEVAIEPEEILPQPIEEVKPEERPYAYQESPLPPDKRPY